MHTRSYLEKLRRGTISHAEEKRLGLPMSPALLRRSRASTGATIAAAKAALHERAGVHLAGGTHHAFPDRGEGFCVFNDVAVTCRALQSSSEIQHAVVIDLDVHQGNGTASIFSGDSSVFTFSMHGERNYPFMKRNGDLDVPLLDDTGDDAYLDALQNALQRLPFTHADIAFYLAGADPFIGDRLGRLSLSKSALAARDEIVIRTCLRHGVPIAVVMAGGYADVVDDIVEIHSSTVLRLSQASHAPACP